MSRSRSARLGVPGILAAAAFAVWLGAALLPTYGFFIDELYYVACSSRASGSSSAPSRGSGSRTNTRLAAARPGEPSPPGLDLRRADRADADRPEESPRPDRGDLPHALRRRRGRPRRRGEGKRKPIPQYFADRLGWERLVDDVASVVETLPPDERKRAVVFAQAYGPAGAVEWLGRRRHLPPAYAGQNSYFLWGPPPDPVTVAIVLGDNERRLGEIFEEVELAGTHECGDCMPWRNHMPIWLVRRPRVPIATLWASVKHFE